MMPATSTLEPATGNPAAPHDPRTIPATARNSTGPRDALNKLTDLGIKKIARDPVPATKQRFADGGGLFLLRTPAGAMSWRMRYRVAGQEREQVFGLYPDLTLAAARDRRDAVRRMVAEGIDPDEVRKAERATPEAPPTFRRFALDLIAELEGDQDDATRKKWQIQLAGHAVGQFGDRLIGDITAPEVRTWLVDAFQSKGNLHTMHETKRKIAAVFGRAAYMGAIPGNPLDGYALKAMRLKPAKDKGHKAITKDPARFGQLLSAIDGHRGDPSVRGALQLIALTAQRPHMIRELRWSQINWADKTWEINAVDMKGTADQARDHVVPLSDQALAVLKAMLPISGGEDPRTGKSRSYVFPGRFADAPMSDATMNKAIRDLGFDDHVGHGFRASFNTFAKQRLGYGKDQELIDLCLAHVVGSQVQRAYDRADRMDERRQLFTVWADWLTQLRRPNIARIAA